jgi:hypothetical protein
VLRPQGKEENPGSQGKAENHRSQGKEEEKAAKLILPLRSTNVLMRISLLFL